MVFTHVLNEEDRIGRLLASLKNQKYLELRVVISDNHSSDGTVNVIKNYSAYIDIILIHPPRQISLLDHFFYVAEYCKSIISESEGIIYVGADDYFLESSYLEELSKSQIQFPDSIIVPKFVINSLSSANKVTTRGQYNNKCKYMRLFRFLIANHHHGSRFNLGLFNKDMFFYRIDRELSHSKNRRYNSRNSIGEFHTLIDLILKYRVVVNNNATFVKEVNNRIATDIRTNENYTQIQLSKLTIMRNLYGKNSSTFRLLKQRGTKNRAVTFVYCIVGLFSFMRNFSYDFYLYSKKLIRLIMAR